VGIVMPADAADPGPGLMTDLGALVDGGKVKAMTSIAAERPLRWH
jgi:hypothetical protein